MHLDFNERIIRVISLINILSLLAALSIILITGPATGFEPSIYDSYPWFFWIFLISPFFISIIILIYYALYDRLDNLWIFSFFTIILSDVILFSLPFIRGYVTLGSGDILTHIGYMKDILQEGNIPTSNIYPALHLIGVDIHLISNLSLEKITMFIPLLFSFVFILCFIALAQQITKNRSEFFLLLALVTIPSLGIVHDLFSPNHEAFLLLPLFLYLIFKFINNFNQKSLIFCIILFSLAVVFFHPLVTIYLILFFLFVSIIRLTKLHLKVEKQIPNFYLPLSMVTVIFLSWSTYIFLFGKTFIKFIDAIVGHGDVVSEMQRYTRVTQTHSIDIEHLIQYILNVYGQNMILGGLAFFCILFVIWAFIYRKTKVPVYLFFSIFGFLFFLVSALISLLTIDIFGWGRLYFGVKFFSLILIPLTILGFLDYLLLRYKTNVKNVIKLLFIGITLVLILYFSIFNIYMSPITRTTNQQVTTSDFTGMSFFFELRDTTIPAIEFGPSQDRYYDALYGKDAKRVNIFYASNGELSPLDHFGYTNSTHIKSKTGIPEYLIINDQGKTYYPALYPEFINDWRFTPGDIKKVHDDQNADYVYSNSNVEVFVINS